MKLVSTIIALGAVLAAAAPHSHSNYPILNQTVIWQPPKNYEGIYPRYVELQDGTVLVTVSRRGPKPKKEYFPVYSSKDHGKTWTHISNIRDTVNGNGFGAQPALMELTEEIGGFPKGTILASGNSESDTETRIDVYASHDKGHTWKFVSHVARGGEPEATNGFTPIWEPYLMIYEHQIVCYYSDQRDPKHGQKLAHQVSTDLKNWGPVVNDVAYNTYSDRPGMTIIAHLPDDTWMLVHEYPGGYTKGLGQYPVYYRIASSPLEFDSAEGIPIIADGFQPSSSPYVVWSPVGGPNGTIVVSDADHSGIFVNTELGERSSWRYHITPQPKAYSRALAFWQHKPDHLAIIGGANFDGVDPPGVIRPLSISVIDINKVLKENGPPPIKPFDKGANDYHS